MDFGHTLDSSFSQDPSSSNSYSDSGSQSDHFYSGSATGQSVINFTGDVGGALPLANAQSGRTENQSGPSGSSAYHEIGSFMSPPQFFNGQGNYSIDDSGTGGGTEPSRFGAPMDSVISRPAGQVRPTAPFTWHPHRHPGDYQGYSQPEDYLHPPRYYSPGSISYHRGFRLMNDQEKTSYQVSNTSSNMSPSQTPPPQTGMQRAQAYVEQQVKSCGLYNPFFSGETTSLPRLIKTLPRRPWVQPPDPAAAPGSVQDVVHNERIPIFLPSSQGEGHSVQPTFASPQYEPPLPCHPHLPPHLAAGISVPPYPDGPPTFGARDRLLASNPQMGYYVDPRHLPSHIDPSASPTSTRRVQRKRKRPAEEDDYSHTCGWGGICTTKIHPNYVWDHLRIHLEGVHGNRARCQYIGCSKAMKKDGLARHYLTHFGARAECCECRRNFARADEITRGHKTENNVHCPSTRWRRFTIDDSGNRNYI